MGGSFRSLLAIDLLKQYDAGERVDLLDNFSFCLQLRIEKDSQLWQRNPPYWCGFYEKSNFGS